LFDSQNYSLYNGYEQKGFYKGGEAFEKCSILFKFKEGANFNHRNTLSILRIKI
jgi:hypothetical protein